MTKLTVADITDLRAYERERDTFRSEIIALKKLRRVSVGPVATLVFENARTMRFQVQEMARAEKISTDEGIAAELAVYNPLIPDPGHLSATLFLELTSDDQLREWLPKLVGIETAAYFRLGSGGDAHIVRCVVDPEHAAQLTRTETTASVHYVSFAFTPEEVEAFEEAEVALAFDHADYVFSTTLEPATAEELRRDLRG